MKVAGPPGASSNGFNENLALFNSGKCGIWIDATVRRLRSSPARIRPSPTRSASRWRPNDGLGKNANWLWSWSLAIPTASKKIEAAEKFISWATDKAYLDLVASKDGWSYVPPGTRTSLYKNPDYLKAASFASQDAGIDGLRGSDAPGVKPVPYVGVQFVAIPEFPGIATDVGQDFSAALAGKMTVDAALATAQSSSEAAMKKAGYIK